MKFEELTPESFDFLQTDSLTYESASLGFSITFPESWSGYYRVAEDKRTMNVYFMGDSEISRAPLFGEEPGLYLFSIAPMEDVEEYGESVDNVQEIGQSNGTTFYYFSATDCSTCLLYYTDDLEEDDDEERMLRESDYRRYELKNKDIDKILHSFSS